MKTFIQLDPDLICVPHLYSGMVWPFLFLVGGFQLWYGRNWLPLVVGQTQPQPYWHNHHPAKYRENDDRCNTQKILIDAK